MPKILKQATLSALKGVVVYEDILRHKARLETDRQSPDVLISSLGHLSEKRPCREALLTTDIYSTVKDLCSHERIEVANTAKTLCDAWDSIVNNDKANNRPLVEVRYDLKTQHFRKTALQFFIDELGNTEDDKKLADILEKEIFHISKRLVTGTYRKTTRKIVFVLRHNPSEKNLLKTSKILPQQFVLKYRK